LNSKKTLRFNTYKELKDYFDIDDDIFLVMDSGGFSVSTLGDIDIKPYQVIEMSEVFNADIMMSLDIPPYNHIDATKPFHLNNKEFDEKMNQSFANAKYMSENSNNFQGKYYICIHGDSIERLNKWFNLHRNLKCDGYALGPKSKGDYWELARELLWLYDKGIRENIHFLAFSGITTLPVLVYFSRYVKNLTYDSSSWAGGAIRREFCLPFLKEKIIYGNSTNYDIEPFCSCAVCRQLDSMQDFHNQKFGGALLSLHNLMKYEELDSMLRGLIKEKELFLSIVKKYISSKILNVFDYIDFGINHGFEAAELKYGSKLKNVNYRLPQKKLFHF
jgi:queuine/archaeosine tRNA-ribosyltransferase